MAGLSCDPVVEPRVPIAKEVTIFPGKSVFFRPVDHAGFDQIDDAVGEHLGVDCRGRGDAWQRFDHRSGGCGQCPF